MQQVVSAYPEVSRVGIQFVVMSISLSGCLRSNLTVIVENPEVFGTEASTLGVRYRPNLKNYRSTNLPKRSIGPFLFNFALPSFFTIRFLVVHVSN